jgi:hypothetical protein
MIATNLDVGRHEVWNRWIGAAEQHVFAGGFEETVGDLEGPWTVPSRNRL